MKRRDFLQSVVTVPAGAVLLEGSGEALSPASVQGTTQPVPPRPPTAPAATSQDTVLRTVSAEEVAALTPRYLSAVQFATLRRLSDLLVPALAPNPGALAAQAPQFIDNYLALSASDRQRLYRDGLDDLNKQAQSRFKKPFADLSTAEADAIVKPLFKVRGPTMSVVDLGPFINRVHQDVRTVTMNSPQWNAAQAAAGNPVARLLHWRNVDPTVPRSGVAPWQTKTTRS
jgi:hypothetical protein